MYTPVTNSNLANWGVILTQSAGRRLKTEAVRSFETFLHMYQTARSHLRKQNSSNCSILLRLARHYTFIDTIYFRSTAGTHKRLSSVAVSITHISEHLRICPHNGSKRFIFSYLLLMSWLSLWREIQIYSNHLQQNGDQCLNQRCCVFTSIQANGKSEC